MIPYIDKLLHDWARWGKTRQDGGLGYPSQAAGTDLSPKGDAVQGVWGFDEQALEVDSIVCRMKKDKPQLWEVVDWYYLTGATGHHIASKLKCHRDTMYARLHSSHSFVMEAMNDNEINKC